MKYQRKTFTEAVCLSEKGRSEWDRIFGKKGEAVATNENILQVTHPRDGVVWSDPELDAKRRERCLCWNCDLLKPDSSENCDIAQRFFNTCVDGGAAIIVTRCAFYRPKN